MTESPKPGAKPGQLNVPSKQRHKRAARSLRDGTARGVPCTFGVGTCVLLRKLHAEFTCEVSECNHSASRG